MNSHHLSLSSKFCLQSCVWEYWEGVCVKKQNYHLCLWWFHSNPCLVWTCNLHCRQIVGRRIIGIGFRNNPCLSWLCSVKLLSIPAPREVISLTCIPVLSLSAGWCAGMLWRTARNLILKCFGFFTCCFVPLSVRRVLTFLALSLAGRACSIQWLWYSICCTPYSSLRMGIHLCDHLRCCCWKCLCPSHFQNTCPHSGQLTDGCSPGWADTVAEGSSARQFLLVTVQFILI